MIWGYLLLFYLVVVRGRIIPRVANEAVFVDNEDIPAAFTKSCGRCSHPTAGGSTSRTGKVATDNLQFEYATGANRCEQLTLKCTGNGAVEIVANADSDAEVTIVSGHNRFGPTNVTSVLSCFEEGWGNSTTTIKLFDDKFTCLVDKEAEVPHPSTVSTVASTTVAGTSTISASNTCGGCQPAVIGHGSIPAQGSIPFMPSTYNQQFDYSQDANGCELLTVTCAGYGNARLRYANTFINMAEGDIGNLTTIFATLPCVNGQWNGMKPKDDRFFCYVQCPVENSTCGGRTDSTSTISVVDGVSSTAVTSKTETTTASEETIETKEHSTTDTTTVTSTTKSKLCEKPCLPAIVVFEYGASIVLDSGGKAYGTCNQKFSYSLDDYGCQKLTINCTGYGDVSLYLLNSGFLNDEKADKDKLTTATQTMHCRYGGWDGRHPQAHQFGCFVEKEVENPLPCPGEETTTTASTAPTTTSETPSLPDTTTSSILITTTEEITTQTEKHSTTEPSSTPIVTIQPETTTTSSSTASSAATTTDEDECISTDDPLTTEAPTFPTVTTTPEVVTVPSESTAEFDECGATDTTDEPTTTEAAPVTNATVVTESTSTTSTTEPDEDCEA